MADRCTIANCNFRCGCRFEGGLLNRHDPDNLLFDIRCCGLPGPVLARQSLFHAPRKLDHRNRIVKSYVRYADRTLTPAVLLARRIGRRGTNMKSGVRPHCPICGAPEIRRSQRRNWAERVAGLFLLPYRCERCENRFYAWRMGPNRDVNRDRAHPVVRETGNPDADRHRALRERVDRLVLELRELRSQRARSA